MVDPNFLIIGTAAGGTSFLTEKLIQHPDIYLPRQMRPEPHYFYKSWEYSKGLDYYRSRWFSSVPKASIAVGERSSSYLFGGSEVAARIHQVFPDMKFIAVLRNPVERTWANYRYTVLEGLENLPFMEAITEEKTRIAQQDGIWAEIQPFNYTGRGFYARQILEFLEFFPTEALLVVKSEDLAARTDDILIEIMRFLGLSTTDFGFGPATDHTSVDIRDPHLQTQLRGLIGEPYDRLVEAVRRNEFDAVIKREAIDPELVSLFKSNVTSEKSTMSDEARSYLRELFADDIEQLRSLVPFDVSDWLTK